VSGNVPQSEQTVPQGERFGLPERTHIIAGYSASVPQGER